MKSLYYPLFIIIILIISCKSSKSSATPEQIKALEELVEQRTFRIESTWANPQTTNAMQQVLNTGILGPGNNAGSINLIGNPNFLKIKGDSINSYLPYFGERQMNVSYGGTDSAIQLKSLMQSLEIHKNEDESYSLNFEADSEKEHYNVFIRIFPNMKTSMVLNGNSRFTISYEGTVEPFVEDDKN